MRMPGMRYGCGCSVLVVAALWYVVAWVTLDKEADPLGLALVAPLLFGLFVGGGLLLVGLVTDILGLDLRSDDDSTENGEANNRDQT